MAGAVGFEPTDLVGTCGFQDRCLNPLGHAPWRKWREFNPRPLVEHWFSRPAWVSDAHSISVDGWNEWRRRGESNSWTPFGVNRLATGPNEPTVGSPP